MSADAEVRTLSISNEPHLGSQQDLRLEVNKYWVKPCESGTYRHFAKYHVVGSQKCVSFIVQ